MLSAFDSIRITRAIHIDDDDDDDYDGDENICPLESWRFETVEFKLFTDLIQANENYQSLVVGKTQ